MSEDRFSGWEISRFKKIIDNKDKEEKNVTVIKGRVIPRK